MYRFIKFKKLDDFSLDDLNNCTASFGLFSIFSDQCEFDGLVDSKYLNEKYNDSSITDKNVIEVIVKHINQQYLQFSLAKLSDDFNYEDVMPKMYKDYCGGKPITLDASNTYKPHEDLELYLVCDPETGEVKVILEATNVAQKVDIRVKRKRTRNERNAINIPTVYSNYKHMDGQKVSPYAF